MVQWFNGSMVPCFIDTFTYFLYNKIKFIRGDFDMTLSKHSEYPENELRLTLDARKRVSLAKLLPDYEVCSFRAYTEGDKIILEPMAEIPAHELWLYKNPQALKDVQEGLQQSKEGKVRKRGSFAKYAQDDI
jgi:hypothetical protein